MRVFALACLFMVGAARMASAAVTVTIEPGPGAQFAQAAGADLTTLQNALQTEIENTFQTLNVKDYLQAFTDAQAFTTKGLGVDYASNLKFVEIGVQANASLNVEKNYKPQGESGDPPIGGLGTNLTFMAGLNLGMLGLEQVTLFGNYYRGTATIEEFSGKLSNYGGHVHVKFLRPKSSLLAGTIDWGGIAVTSGFDYSRMRLSLTKNLTTTMPLADVGGEAAEVLLDSLGTFDMEVEAWSVPLEVTTSLRLLWLATLYGGLGFDWQFAGKSSVNMALNSDMTGSIPSQGFTLPIGTATIQADEKGEPSAGRLRFLVGAQLNFAVVRLFAQLNVMPGERLIAGVAAGLRLAY